MNQFDTSIAFVFAARSCGMEARDTPWYRTQVNPCTGRDGRGKRAAQREARYPIVAGAVEGAAITGTYLPLPQEICVGPRLWRGSGCGVNDNSAKPTQKSDHPIVALKPGNAGGAKGVTS